MAFIHPNSFRPTLRRILWSVADNPTATFGWSIVPGTVGVACVALALPEVKSTAAALAVVVFLCASTFVGWALHHEYPHRRLGACNLTTLARLALVCALMAPLAAGAAPSWPFFWLAVVTLLLDGVDGWLARREGLLSEFGARFDLEVDSILALVLALNAAMVGGMGLLAGLLGLPRYAFGLASLLLPWMSRPLPERFSRKVVCVLQLSVLIALQAPILPSGLSLWLIGAALFALAWSFATDVIWLWRRRA